MSDQKHHTTKEELGQENGCSDDWTKEVVPRLPAHLEEQARDLKAFERKRLIGTATDLLRGLLAYVYTTNSFKHLGMWSVLVGLADVSANDWRKRLRKASAWLDWLLQEVLAMAEPLSPWLMRSGARRILLVDATHWKCLGPKGIVMRVHTAFDLLSGQLTQVKVTDDKEGEHLEVFDLKCGDLVVTDRANGLRERVAFVQSKLADLIVRITPRQFPMEDEQGAKIVVVDWLKALHAPEGAVFSRLVWVTHKKQRIKLRFIALRLSEEQQKKAERRTKRKASKNQKKVYPNTVYLSGWVLLATTLNSAQWSDQQVLRLYQARWHIELLFKRIKQFLHRQSLRCKTLETAKPTITALLLGWALLEQESAVVRLSIRDAMSCVRESKLQAPLITAAAFWQEDLDASLSEWMLVEACFDLLCQQIRGSYTAERFRACLPRLQRFLYSGHRHRPLLYRQVCRWLSGPATVPDDEGEVLVA
jgi:hypothetical protein